MKKINLFCWAVLSLMFWACSDNEAPVAVGTAENEKVVETLSEESEKEDVITPALSFLNNAFLQQEKGVKTKAFSSVGYARADVDYVKDWNYTDGSPLLKLVCFKRGGYMLLNNTGLFNDTGVLFFSEEKFDPSNINPGLVEYVEEFVAKYELRRKTASKEQYKKIKQFILQGKRDMSDDYWGDPNIPYQKLRIVLGTTTFIKEYTAPLLSTNWHQDSPFNTSCPIINGKHAPAGCVAVALGQIINYHKKHVKYYNWSKINTDTPTTDDLPNFLRDIGDGVGMIYGENNSEAYESDADIYLRTSGYLVYRNAFNFDKVKRQIVNKHRPVYLFGKSKRKKKFLWVYEYYGGHAWVGDGYKKVQCTDSVRYVELEYGVPVNIYEKEETREIEFLHMNWGGGFNKHTWVTYDYTDGYTLNPNEEEGHKYKYRKGMMICY